MINKYLWGASEKTFEPSIPINGLQAKCSVDDVELDYLLDGASIDVFVRENSDSKVV